MWKSKTLDSSQLSLGRNYFEKLFQQLNFLIKSSHSIFSISIETSYKSIGAIQVKLPTSKQVENIFIYS